MRCEGAFRKAQITARQNLIAAQKAEREFLLKSYLEPRSSNSSPAPGQQRRHKPHPELSKEEKTVNASSDVTLALRRTHDMMAAELSRSQFAHDTLKDSTAALAQLSETYSTLDTMLSSSKNLLGTLLRSQKSDTWYLETAFYVLLATIGWLIWRRILYGPTWWLLWFPMKMFIKGWMGVFAAMGLRGGLSSDLGVGSSSMHGRETVVHNSATRGPRPNMSGASAPTVSVCGGGKGAPMSGSPQPGQGSEERVSEQVGRIIDESQDDQTVPESLTGDVTEGEEAGTQKNSKKRMWEEDKEVAKEAQRKDEL
jgi:protein transport protein SEC20